MQLYSTSEPIVFVFFYLVKNQFLLENVPENNFISRL